MITFATEREPAAGMYVLFESIIQDAPVGGVYEVVEVKKSRIYCKKVSHGELAATEYKHIKNIRIIADSLEEATAVRNLSFRIMNEAIDAKRQAGAKAKRDWQEGLTSLGLVKGSVLDTIKNSEVATA